MGIKTVALMIIAAILVLVWTVPMLFRTVQSLHHDGTSGWIIAGFVMLATVSGIGLGLRSLRKAKSSR